MSETAKAKINKEQNHPNFKINYNSQPIIFWRRIFSKVLNLPQADTSKARTVIVKCLVPSCGYIFKSSLITYITNLILIYL